MGFLKVYETTIFNEHLILLIFWALKLLSIGFPMIYDLIILNEYSFLVILGPGTKFRAGQ